MAFLVLFLLGSLGLNLVLVVALLPGEGPVRKPAQAPKFEEQIYRPADAGNDQKIVMIDLEGIISSGVRGDLGDTMIDDVRLALLQARQDDRVQAILLHVNSPGGEVTASDNLFHLIKEAADEKPVIAYVSSVGASGAYYAICGADYLMANRLSLVGSIGVIIQTFNYEELFGKIGLRSVIFKSGDMKDILNGSRPMTPAEEELIDSLVTQSYQRFLEVVVDSRPDAVASRFDDGRILSGEDGVASGLLDENGYLDDAIRKAEELGDAAGAAVIRYHAPFRFGRLFPFLGEAGTPSVEVNLTPSTPEGVEPGRLYFLPGFMLR